jgi:hypothetical protein
MLTKIFTFAFNRPDILQYQIDCFKKYFKREFEFNVVYDTRDSEHLEQFEKICRNSDVTFYHHVSTPGNTPSFYNSNAIQWAYDNLIVGSEEDCYVMILDHDIFLIEDFDIEEFMNQTDLAGCVQTRQNVKYVWQGLILFRKSSVENLEFDFYPQVVDGQMLDSCGGTYKLLRNSELKFKPTSLEYPDDYGDINLKDPEVSNGFEFELHLDSKFLHFRNACAWHNELKVDDQNKTLVLQKILGDFIEV